MLGSICPPGYYGTTALTTADCSRCFCFGITTACSSTELFKNQVHSLCPSTIRNQFLLVTNPFQIPLAGNGYSLVGVTPLQDGIAQISEQRFDEASILREQRCCHGQKFECLLLKPSALQKWPSSILPKRQGLWKRCGISATSFARKSTQILWRQVEFQTQIQWRWKTYWPTTYHYCGMIIF